MQKLKKQVQRVEEKQDNILSLLKQQGESSFSIVSSQYKASNSMAAGSADNMFICMHNTFRITSTPRSLTFTASP